MPVRTELARCRPRSGCSRSMRPMVSRMRAVTALRARSAGSPARRGRPSRPRAAASSAAMKSRSAPALLGSGEVVAPFGVGHLVLELGEAAPVLGPRPRVEQLAQVAHTAHGRAGRIRAGPGEVEHMHLAAGLTDQPGQVVQSLGVLHPHRPTAERQGPELAIASEHGVRLGCGGSARCGSGAVRRIAVRGRPPRSRTTERRPARRCPGPVRGGLGPRYGGRARPRSGRARARLAPRCRRRSRRRPTTLRGATRGRRRARAAAGSSRATATRPNMMSVVSCSPSSPRWTKSLSACSFKSSRARSGSPPCSFTMASPAA